MKAADAWVVAEPSLADWLHAAFEAERAPQRPRRLASMRAPDAGRTVASARPSFWWMLGLSVIAIALH